MNAEMLDSFPNRIPSQGMLVFWSHTAATVTELLDFQHKILEIMLNFKNKFMGPGTRNKMQFLTTP